MALSIKWSHIRKHKAFRNSKKSKVILMGSRRDAWNPKDYTLTDQIKDIAHGWDVSADDASVRMNRSFVLFDSVLE